MRHYSAISRISMEHFLPRTTLLLLLGASSLPLFTSTAVSVGNTQDSWDSLQLDHEQVIASLNVVELLERHHYNKPPLNDERSAKIYDSCLKILGPARMYLTAGDITKFDRWRNRSDDFLKNGNLNPSFVIYKRHLDRLKGRLNYALAILGKSVDKIDFSVDEGLPVDRKRAPWAKDTTELGDLWRREVKDEVLRLRITGKDNKAIRGQLAKRYKNQLSRLRQTRSKDIFQAYINAFARSYDPHTQYLSPNNAENFDINMSLSLEGIGAMLQGDNDYVKIVRLVPTGPVAKSKQIATSDKAIGVAQSKGEMVGVVGWCLNEVVKLIRGPKGSRVRLEVIPASNAPNDQTSKIVAITREAMELGDQAAKRSTIKIDHEGRSYKLGMVDLPAFYLGFKIYRTGDPNYKGTTRDVKKLITELQRDRVDGIVLDLRNNGGGSLQGATRLTGLFINQGPTVLVRNSNGRVDVLNDDESRAFYIGPLAMLVNRLSTSTSEVFAGAMQDYHHALILGGQTFGKGTVQTIQPLNCGELKLALAKFYRVSEQSTQHQGMIPDISYPSTVDDKEIGESALPGSIPWDTIRPVVKDGTNPFKPFLAQLKVQRDACTENNADFAYARERLALARELMKEKTVSLNEAKRRAQQTSIKNRQLAMENAPRKSKGQEPLEELKRGNENALSEEDDKTKPQDDTYLTEPRHILLDYLNLNSAVAKHRAQWERYETIMGPS